MLNPSPDLTYIYSNIDCSARIYSSMNTSTSKCSIMIRRDHMYPPVIIFHKIPYSVVTMMLDVIGL